MKKNITFIFFLLAGTGVSIAQTAVSQKKTPEPAVTSETSQNASPDSVQVILLTSKQQPVENSLPATNQNNVPETNPQKITPVISTRKPE